MSVGSKAFSNFRASYDQKPKPVAPPPAAALTTPPAAPAAPSVTRPEREFVAPTLQKTAVEKFQYDRSGIDKQFDANRERAKQSEAASLQGQRDAIARRAASLGGGPGGAMVKVEQLAANESAARLQQANSEIDAAKDAELRRVGELETQVNMQREEAQAGRDMQKYTADLGLAVQKYGMELDADFKDIANNLAVWSQGSDNYFKDQTLAMSKDENEFNKKQAVLTQLQNLKTAGFTPPEIDQILSGLGLEDLGLDLSQVSAGMKREPMIQPSNEGGVAMRVAIMKNRELGYTDEELRAAGFKV